MSTFSDDGVVDVGEKNAKIIVGVTILVVFVAMLTEKVSPEVAFLYALIIVMMTGIVTLKQALSGFSNESLITIGTLYLVIAAVEKSYIIDAVARKAFGMNSSPYIGSLRMFVTTFSLSSVFNNTPLVAVMIPVVRDWGRAREIPLSRLLMPLSYSVLAGGLLTMIGTSTNLTVQGLVKDDRGFEFPFLAPGFVCLPCGILVILYLVFAGPYLLPSKSGLIRELRDHASELVVELEVMGDSNFTGRDVGEMCSAVGLSASNILKIRRLQGVAMASATPIELKSESSNQAQESGLAIVSRDVELGANEAVELRGVELFPSHPSKAADGNASHVSISDEKYLSRTLPSWGPEQKPRARTLSSVDGGEPLYRDILNPTLFEVVHAGDIIFLSNPKDVLSKLMKTFGSEKKGLRILKSSVTDIPGFGTDLAEVVISNENPFVGRDLFSCMSEFSEKYSVAVISARKRLTAAEETVSAVSDVAESCESIHAAPSKESRSLVLGAGDVVLCLAKDATLPALQRNKDFFVVTAVGSIPKPITLYGVIPLVVFLVMIIVVALEKINMCPAAIVTAGIFFAGGWIKAKEIPDLVDLRLLMLMGCSLSFAKSMESSGLAAEIASWITAVETTSTGYLFMVYLITLMITELVSNNAAAALMYPFAVAVADQLKVSYIPFVYVVMISATAAFMSPIGYQTHVMVWGPGGYNFFDFVKFGVVPNIIYCVGTCLLVTIIYPF